MIITKPAHKSLLLSLFYDGSGERRFSMATIDTAAGCFAKLWSGGVKTTIGDDTTVTFADGDLEFNEAETELLGDLIAGLSGVTPTEYANIREIRTLINP